MMKRTFALMLSAALLLGIPLIAQQGPGGGPGPGGARGERRMGAYRRGPDAERRLQFMSQRLNLSQEQQEKLKPILQDQRQQMEAVRQDTSLSFDQRRAKMQELRQNFTTQINGVLTPEQQKQWEEQRQKMNDHRQRKGGGRGPAASNPNPGSN